MTTLVVGATGATGRLLVEQLLTRGHQVKVIVRSPEKLPQVLRRQDALCVLRANILELSDEELSRSVDGCAAVASCLGHVLSLRGIYGQPRRLVTDATRRLCRAISASGSGKPVKFVLMNTAGNSNRDLQEAVPLGQRVVISLLRRILPPHADNEQAADFVRTEICRDNGAIEWAVVRPDTLIDQSEVTAYEAHPSPTRSALFDPGQISRINVAHFMAELITNEDTWHRWKGRMPVLYNTVPCS